MPKSQTAYYRCEATMSDGSTGVLFVSSRRLPTATSRVLDLSLADADAIAQRREIIMSSA